MDGVGESSKPDMAKQRTFVLTRQESLHVAQQVFRTSVSQRGDGQELRAALRLRPAETKMCNS